MAAEQHNNIVAEREVGFRVEKYLDRRWKIRMGHSYHNKQYSSDELLRVIHLLLGLYAAVKSNELPSTNFESDKLQINGARQMLAVNWQAACISVTLLVVS